VASRGKRKKRVTDRTGGAKRRAGRPSAAKKAPVRILKADWPRLLGEGTLLLLVFVLPLIMNPFSRSIMDVKDFALGIGVAAGLALVLISSLARGGLSWASVRLNAAVGAYLAVALVTLVYSRYRFATISELAKLASHVGLYWLVILSVREMRQVRRMVGAAALAAALVCSYAFMQALGRDPFTWGTATTRVFSFLGNATYLAGFLVLLMPLVIAAGWPGRGVREPRGPSQASGSLRPGVPRGNWGPWVLFAFSLVVAAMMLFSLYLTISLSPAIGLILGVLLSAILFLVRGGRRAARRAVPAVAVGLLLFLVVGYVGYLKLPRSQQERVHQVLHFQDPYGKERGLIRGVGFDIFRNAPLVGEAYGTYAMYALERLAPDWYADLGKSTSTMLVPNYPHNEFIEVLAETGVVGGLVFVALILGAFAASVSMSLRHPEPEWARLALAITAGMTAFIFQNQFGITFRQTGTVTFFWLSLGFLAVAQARALRLRSGQAPAPAGAAPGLALRQIQFGRPRLPVIGAATIGAVALVAALAWLGLRPVRSNILLRQAEQEAKRGLFEAAARHADRALELNPYSSHAYYIAAYAWGSLGNYQRSLEANQKALALLPGNAGAYYNLGVSYKQLRRLEEARESFARAIELMPTSMRQHAAMAETLVELGRYDEALPYAQEAVRLEPRNAGLHLLLADIQSRRGKLAASAAQLEQAARLRPNDLSLLPKLAESYLRLGDLDKAVAAGNQWIGLSPGSPDARLLLAEVRGRRGDFAGAAAQLEEAARLAPGNVRVLRGLAQLYFSRLRDWDKAINAANRWLSLSPDEPEAYSILGAARYGKRDYAAARSALQRAVELQPANLRARLQLAYCYLQLKQMPVAKRELEWLASKHPATPEGKRAAQLLAQGYRNRTGTAPGGAAPRAR
jgi:tetratricopeptide (TPR) repeat protein/O-antigen ligase